MSGRPFELFKGKVLVYEMGGGRSNTGRAHSWCDVNGNPVLKFGTGVACGKHGYALWELGKPIVWVYVGWLRGSVKPIFVHVDKGYFTLEENNDLKFVEESEWKEELLSSEDELVIVPKVYENAVRHTIAKAMCYHCRRTHYYIKTKWLI